MRLYSIGLGIFTRAISSANPDAQAYFNQGFQMMYAFAKPEAIASFREARRRDPSCAICFWGEAWAYGPYLNGAIAIQAAKDYAKLMGDTGFHALTLVRFGRFDEVEAVRTRPVQGLSAGFWDFAQGYARLRMGDTRAAREYLARVREGATSPARFRFHSAADLLGVVGDILEGELERAAGDLPAAIARFERAVITEDGLTYDEPEPLPFAARHCSAPHCSRPAARPMPSASIAKSSTIIPTTAGRSSACVRRSSPSRSRRPTSTRTSPRAGRGQIPGSAPRASDAHGGVAARSFRWQYLSDRGHTAAIHS